MAKYVLNSLIVAVLGVSQTIAQVSFTNQVSRLSDPTHYSGVAVTVNDVNHDGLDDIVILEDASDLVIEYQNLDGTWTSYAGPEVTNESGSGNAWGMAVGDADNNGFSDVFAGTFPGFPDYARASVDGLTYSREDLPNYSLATQCVNLADMDADGDLDFFSCGDTGPSGIWENDGNGDFTYSGDDIIPMTPTDNPGWGSWDGSGNYGSTFTDYDLDGDLDFYITHCRQGVSNPDDPRRINQMFINDGNGNYTEDFSNANALRIGAQSWTTDFQDFDNDGDFDAFITNHDVDNMLLENQNGVFVDIYENSGLDMSVGTPIQGLMRDFNNDMYVDVLVTGSDNNTTYALYLNNGDKTFTRVDGVFGQSGLYSIATGDLNHDGFLDVYGSYATIYTNPSNTPDAVWVNDGNDNNWFAVDLEGTISNRSAVGSVVRLYGPWGMQVREVRSGESYGICNSFTSYFGLAQNTEIDSVVVDWPSSGIHQVIENPSPNQFLTIIEDECVAPEAIITANGSTTICAGSSVELAAPVGAGYTYEWSDGSNGQTLEATAAGVYMVRVTDANSNAGCSAVSASVEVVISPDETPEISVQGELTLCEGDAVTLTSSEAIGYSWSGGLGTDQSAEVTEAGSYSVTITGLCDDFTSGPVDVEVLAAPAPTVNDVQLSEPGTADLVASGSGSAYNWYDVETSGNLLGSGANFTTPTVNQTTSFWAEEVHTYQGAISYGGKTDRTTSGGSFHQNTSFYLLFDVIEEMTLNSVKVYADGAGDRTLYIEDENGNTVLSETINIPDGESRVEFADWVIPVGNNYRFRVQESGHGLWRDNSQGQVNFPYNIGGLTTITGANTSSPVYYYYFFDWEVQEADRVCVSERAEAVVSLNIVGVEEGELSDVSIYPNPANDVLNILLPENVEGAVNIELIDMTGKVVSTYQASNKLSKVDVSSLSAGVYMLRVVSDKGRFNQRVIVN